MLRRRARGWLVGGVASAQILLGGGAVRGQEPLRAGAVEVTLAAGYSVSHHIAQSPSGRVEGLHLVPHLGYVLTDLLGPGWLRGNLELLGEPTLLHLEDGDSATVAGLAALGRWVFAGWRGVRPYVEAGVGVVGGDVNLRETNCDVNFLIEGGPGVLFVLGPRLALTAGYRVHHVSNADLCTKNRGLNSSLFTVGLSYFLR